MPGRKQGGRHGPAGLMDHPMRQQVLIACRGQRCSPKQFSVARGVKLGTAAYHFRTLADAKLIVPAGVGRGRRGAPEHFYVLAPTGRAVLEARAVELERMIAELRGPEDGEEGDTPPVPAEAAA